MTHAPGILILAQQQVAILGEDEQQETVRDTALSGSKCKAGEAGDGEGSPRGAQGGDRALRSPYCAQNLLGSNQPPPAVRLQPTAGLL